MQMCCHETLYDCPYYEQQMYPGDTRVQLNVLSALSRDDRMIKRAIELYDLASRDDGQCPFNWPTRGLQEGATYTLCYLLMYGDYVMNHTDRAWLKARLPGFRRTLSGLELYENDKGLLANLPGWSFMDWVPEWRNGVAPDGVFGEGVNAEANLFWLLALQSAARVERAFGNGDIAAHWEHKAIALKRAIVDAFWSEERGLFADTVRKDDFSEHAQCLALLADVLPAEKEADVFRHLITDADLKRCTVYFSYYLFETYFKFGRGDLFLKRLDLWRDYVKKGLTTTQEAPDVVKVGKTTESRSDCHAWGAHPIWFMQTGLAGIRSDAPFFAKVRVAPAPGDLKSLKAKHPHPQGWIEVDLRFADGVASGTVKTPVAGTFVYGGCSRPLKVGVNKL
jgi:alpha-L-rhamnosidase